MKNEFIVLEQPKRLIFSVVLVDSELPVSETIHESLKELGKVSDIFFIIPEKSGIKPSIFASLYKACGYIEAKNPRSEILMRTLEYDTEIFRSHSLVLYSQTSCFPRLLDPEKLQRLCASDINKPVFKMRALGSTEFFDIYKKKEEGHGFFKWFIPPHHNSGSENLYCSDTIDGSSIIVRPGIVKRWLELWKNDPDYVSSFTMPDQRYFLASMCRKLDLENLNLDIDELEV